MLNPPEKTEMELTKACPQGAHSQMGARQGAEATNPVILLEAEDTGSGGLGSEGAQQRGTGLDRSGEGQEDFLEDAANKQGFQDIGN